MFNTLIRKQSKEKVGFFIYKANIENVTTKYI
jgi:hypothetical protein